jgi:tetratricopeptide (TPR) repeat protein
VFFVSINAMSKTKNILSIILTIFLLLAGVILSLCYFSLWNLNDYWSSIKEYLKDPEAEWIVLFTVIGMSTTLLFSLIAYLFTLDHQRNKRPHVLIYLCFFGMSLQISSFVGANLENYITLPFLIPVCLLIAFGSPFLIYPVESFFRNMFFSLGKLVLSWNWRRVASYFLHKALLFNPQDRQLRETLGQSFHRAGRRSQSRSILLPLIQTGALSETSLRFLAEGFETEEQWERAIEFYNKILELKPGNKKISEILIALYIKNEQPDNAIPILEPLVDYKSLKDILRLEDLYARLHRMDRVRELLLKAAEIEKPPCNATLLEYRRLLKTHPVDKAFLQDLADLCWSLDRKTEAAEYYEEILLVEPDNKPLRRKILEFYFETSQPKLVERHIEYLVRQGDLSPIILQEYAELLMQKEDINGARQYLEKARELYPDQYQFPYTMAQLYYNEKHYDKARQEMATALRLVPPEKKDQIQILYRKIDGAILNVQIKKLRTEIENDPQNVDLRFILIDQLMANAYLERVTYEIDTLLYYHPELKSKVIEHIEELVNKHDRNFLLLDYLADMYLREQNFDKCMGIYEKMYTQSLDPKEVTRDCCGKILSMNPNYLPARKRLGDLARDEKDWPVMIEHYSFCMKDNEDIISDRLGNLFEGLYATGSLEKAGEIGLKLIAKEPENPLFFKKLGILYIDMARFQDAVDIFEKALKLDPENREINSLFQKAVNSLKNQQLEDLLKRLEAEPDNSGYREQAGDLLCFFEKYTDAVIHYQRAAQLAPEADLSKAKLAFSLAKMGMMDLAEETLDEIKLSLTDSSDQESLKQYFYDTARQFDRELEPQRALKFYKQIFRIDAAYKDIVDRIEKIESRGFVISPYGKKIKTSKPLSSGNP